MKRKNRPTRRPAPPSDTAQPSAVPTPERASGPWRRRVLVATCIALVAFAWLADLPGRSLRALARRAMDDNRPHAALAWIDRASQSERLRLIKADDETPRLRALILLRLNLQAPAMEALAKAQSRGGDRRQLHAYRDLARSHQGDAQAVERISDDGAEFLPPQAIFEATVRYAQYHGRFSWALEVCSLWHQQHPDDAVALYHRGRMHELRHDLDPAEADYRRALEMQPSLHRAAYRLGMLLKQQRGYEEAEEFFLSCQGSPYEAIADIEAADCLWQRGENDAAWQMIQPHLARDPSSLADLYLQVDEFVDQDRAAITAARVRDSQEQIHSAIELWQRALAYNHRNSEAHVALASLLRRVGREEDADEHATMHERMLAMMRQCAELRVHISDHPEDLDARLELAELYFHCESLAAAQLVVREVLAVDPDHRGAHRLQAQVYLEKARTDPEFAELARQHQRRAQ